MSRKIFYGLIFLLPIISSNVLAEGDVTRGQALYGLCAACHGANGEGIQVMNGPSLAGLSDWYLTRQINNFKEGIRGSNPEDIYGMQMRPMAATLTTDQAVEDVVAYILTLE